jgi:hypothetical protein
VAELTEAGYAALSVAARGHVEQVRQSLFDALTTEQVAQLRAISEAMITAAGGHGRVAFPPTCPSEAETEGYPGQAETEGYPGQAETEGYPGEYETAACSGEDEPAA